jgi:hypothetical protein
MELISSVTVGAGGAANISFLSIPQTYTDLFLVYSTRATVNNSVVSIQFNGDTGSNYTTRWLDGNGTSASSGEATLTTHIRGAVIANNVAAANTFGNAATYIPNYTGSQVKTASTEGVQEDNAAASFQRIAAGAWTGTAAITSLSFYSVSGGDFVQHTTAYLYGILKGSGGATVS